MQYIYKNIPNLLTFGRLAALPFLMLLLYIPAGWAVWTAFFLYAFASFTDWLDGFIARRFNQGSDFGKMLDPIADKIYVAVVLLVLVDIGTLGGLWVIPAVIIFTREFVVSGLREYLGPKGITVPVTPLAKWKTTIQMVALGILILAPVHFAWAMLGYVFILAAMALTLVTGWQYLSGSLPHFEGEDQVN